MRKIALVVCLLIAEQFSAGPAAYGQEQKHSNQDIPAMLQAGFDAYKSQGADAAVKAWIKGSPLDDSKPALTQANNLHQIEDFYGPYRSFEVMSQKELASTTRIIYIVLNYEKGPLFAKFLVFRTEKGWVLTSFMFNTDDQKILP